MSCGAARRYRRDVRLIVAIGIGAALSTALGVIAALMSGDCRWLALCLPALLLIKSG